MHSTILMGTHIGDNVIVGAGSVVSGNIPSNVVIAGNPAKIIRTLDEHIAIRKKKSRKEAFLYYNTFCNAKVGSLRFVKWDLFSLCFWNVQRRPLLKII